MTVSISREEGKLVMSVLELVRSHGGPNGPSGQGDNPAGNERSLPDPAALRRIYDLLAHSVFPDATGTRFDPREPPEAWKNLVRGVLWHEDLGCRRALLDHMGAQTPRTGDPLDKLRRDGWANIGPVEGDVDELVAAAERSFEHYAVAGEDPLRKLEIVPDPLQRIPAAAALLQSDTLNGAARAYIGQDVSYQLAMLARIPADFDCADTSGVWHHDKVGHRLNAFVLLADVDEGGRPTMYARGSHLMDWPAYFYQSSRFDAAFVEGNFTVDALYGKRGDVVLFDTNGLHRATWEGGRSARPALMLEYGSHAKYLALKRIGSFPFGIRPHGIARTVDPARTLIDPRELHDRGSHYVYGSDWPPGLYPNFN